MRLIKPSADWDDSIPVLNILISPGWLKLASRKSFCIWLLKNLSSGPSGSHWKLRSIKSFIRPLGRTLMSFKFSSVFRCWLHSGPEISYFSTISSGVQLFITDTATTSKRSSATSCRSCFSDNSWIFFCLSCVICTSSANSISSSWLQITARRLIWKSLFANICLTRARPRLSTSATSCWVRFFSLSNCFNVSISWMTSDMTYSAIDGRYE